MAGFVIILSQIIFDWYQWVSSICGHLGAVRSSDLIRM